MRIQNIAPCNDAWHYTARPPGASELVYRVVVWALTEAGVVVGMMVPPSSGRAGKTIRLVMQPRIAGSCVLEDNLNVQQRAAVGRKVGKPSWASCYRAGRSNRRCSAFCSCCSPS